MGIIGILRLRGVIQQDGTLFACEALEEDGETT